MRKKITLTQEHKDNIRKGCLGKNKGVWVDFLCDFCSKPCEEKVSHFKKSKNHFCSKGCHAKFRRFVLKPHEQPTWKGGINPINKGLRTHYRYREWRSDIFMRDGYACIFCGAKSGNGKTVMLNADHIKPFHIILKENSIKTLEEGFYCEELWDLNNGRTLCVPCHKAVTKVMWDNKKK